MVVTQVLKVRVGLEMRLNFKTPSFQKLPHTFSSHAWVWKHHPTPNLSFEITLTHTFSSHAWVWKQHQTPNLSFKITLTPAFRAGRFGNTMKHLTPPFEMLPPTFSSRVRVRKHNPASNPSVRMVVTQVLKTRIGMEMRLNFKTPSFQNLPHTFSSHAWVWKKHPTTNHSFKIDLTQLQKDLVGR
jgi:hypothetical protein